MKAARRPPRRRGELEAALSTEAPLAADHKEGFAEERKAARRGACPGRGRSTCRCGRHQMLGRKLQSAAPARQPAAHRFAYLGQAGLPRQVHSTTTTLSLDGALRGCTTATGIG